MLDSVGGFQSPTSCTKIVAARNKRAGNLTDADVQEAREKLLAMQFIRNAHPQHSSYLVHLRNSFLDGNNLYPMTVHQAYHTLQNHSHTPGTRVSLDGVAFTQTGEVVAPRENNGDRSLDHITCFNCGSRGHYANQCTQERQSGHQAFMSGVP